jgi:hypothetical protein
VQTTDPADHAAKSNHIMEKTNRRECGPPWRHLTKRDHRRAAAAMHSFRTWGAFRREFLDIDQGPLRSKALPLSRRRKWIDNQFIVQDLYWISPLAISRAARFSKEAAVVLSVLQSKQMQSIGNHRAFRLTAAKWLRTATRSGLEEDRGFHGRQWIACPNQCCKAFLRNDRRHRWLEAVSSPRPDRP